MLNQQVLHRRTQSLFPNSIVHVSSHRRIPAAAPFPPHHAYSRYFPFPNSRGKFRVGRKRVNSVKARVTSPPTPSPATTAATEVEQPVRVKAIVTINLPVVGFFTNLGVNRVLDNITDLAGKTLSLELASAELDPKTGSERPGIKGYARRRGQEKEDLKLEAEFMVPAGYGEIGAIFVENEYRKELYLKDIVLHGFPIGPVHFTCNSWVQSKFLDNNKRRRVFFCNKSYLPSETPNALVRLRKEELDTLRGNGQGERKEGERIYDYDVYNDLGNPDVSDDLLRPILGGTHQPYPRRCRTGRPRTNKDPASETRTTNIYVPRDEEFSEVKNLSFTLKTIDSSLQAVLPALGSLFVDPNLSFPYFTTIDSLYNEGINLPPLKRQGLLRDFLPNLLKFANDAKSSVLNFETPQQMERDRFSWLRDEEFARQTLAGVNPCMIQLVTEWPLKSGLDTDIYGPAESAISTEMVERQIKEFNMDVEEALKQKKLYILDYHDLVLPFVEQVRSLENTTLYGSRTLFFLTPEGTLTPVAIELTRPPMDGKPQWKEAYTPSHNATGIWLWRLAKAQVLALDSGFHELISHWLRTHCCTEPYIIAAHRQLSAMHPIFRLLHPHFRYTMQINALARLALINGDGIIEISFSPKKYSMLFSAVIYDKVWRFDHQSLPKDLITRGIAEEDPSAPHGLKLNIQDYPFANDGLLLWDILKGWFSDYVNHYYPDPNVVLADEELQAWWSEVRNVGHGDKKDEPWWPELKTPQDLIEIVTIIAWTASAHHAAVNFGQYAFAGYFPNRPTIARINMPTEDPTEESWNMFVQQPEQVLLTMFPSQLQAATVMAVIDVLSNHSPDEQYLGQEVEPAWVEDPVIKAAFEKFSGRLKDLEGIIDKRNGDIGLKNRNGVGVVQYELLKPLSEAGVTGKGVPYSTSI